MAGAGGAGEMTETSKRSRHLPSRARETLIGIKERLEQRELHKTHLDRNMKKNTMW